MRLDEDHDTTPTERKREAPSRSIEGSFGPSASMRIEKKSLPSPSLTFKSATRNLTSLHRLDAVPEPNL